MAAASDIYIRILQNFVATDGGVALAWLIFGSVVLAPALAAHLILEEWRPREFASTQLRQTLFRIVVMLLYPGILGSIFFELLPDLVKVSLNAATLPLIVLEFTIIGHFCYDFIFICANYEDKAVRYRCREYFIDIVVILLLYLCARSVDLGKQTVEVANIGALFSILYLLFLIWDLCRREDWRTSATDAGLMILYLGFTEASGLITTVLGAATPYLLAAIIALGTVILAVTTKRLENPPPEKAKRKHK